MQLTDPSEEAHGSDQNQETKDHQQRIKNRQGKVAYIADNNPEAILD